MLENNSTTIDSQSWFIPCGILMIVSSTFTIAGNVIFLSVMIFDRTCHTVSMMLMGNTCLSLLMFTSMRISMASFTLHNDLKGIEYQYSSCTFLAYMIYMFHMPCKIILSFNKHSIDTHLWFIPLVCFSNRENCNSYLFVSCGYLVLLTLCRMSLLVRVNTIFPIKYVKCHFDCLS